MNGELIKGGKRKKMLIFIVIIGKFVSVKLNILMCFFKIVVYFVKFIFNDMICVCVWFLVDGS